MDHYNQNKAQASLHSSPFTTSPYLQQTWRLDKKNNLNSPISTFSIKNHSTNTKPDEFVQASANNPLALTSVNQPVPITHKYQQGPSWTEYSRSRNSSESSTDSSSMLLDTSEIEAGDKRDRNNNHKYTAHGFCSFSRVDLYSTNYPTCLARALSSLKSFKDQKGLVQVAILVVTLSLAAAIATVFTLSMINTDIEEMDDDLFNQDPNVIKTNSVILDGIEEILITKTSAKRNLEKSLKSSYTNWNENKNGDHKKPILIPMSISLSEDHNPYSRTIENLTPPSVQRTTGGKRHIQNIHPHMQENLHSTLTIKAVEDFRKLGELEDMVIAPKLNTIRIDKLVDEIYVSDPNDALNAFKLVGVENIRHLKIAGPITEAWLSSILNNFQNIESLTINIDELCIGATVRDRDSLVPMRLENLKHLRIENSHFCTISSWIFKWEFPQIEELTMSNSDLTKRTFLPIHAFLEKSKETLSSVTIYKSFICSECVFTDVEYRNIKNIRVLDENENPFMSD